MKGVTLYRDVEMLRMMVLLNRARPQPLSRERTRVFAAPPPFMILSGIHLGTCGSRRTRVTAAQELIRCRGRKVH